MRYLLSLIFLTAPIAAFAHYELNDMASQPGLIHYLFSSHHPAMIIVLCVAIVVLVRRASRGQKLRP
jgi:hypothetical protein